MRFIEDLMAKCKENKEKKIAIQKNKNECNKDLSTAIIINFGHCELDLTQYSIMRQKTNGNIYFNYNSYIEYRIVNYEWNGPILETFTTSNTQGTSNTHKNGKMGKMTAGAVVGTMLMPGVGTAVGAAIGAGGKSKSKTNNNSTTHQTVKSIEKMSSAIISLKRLSDNSIHNITIQCNSEIDARIRCFNMDLSKNISDLSESLNESLEGIKALKQLLDLGAITNEEYKIKKNQLLKL